MTTRNRSRSGQEKVVLTGALCLMTWMLVGSLVPSSLRAALHASPRLHDWAHVIAYAVLTSGLMLASRTRAAYLAGITGTIVLGCGTELAEARAHLSWVELPDVASNVGGILLAIGASHLWRVVRLRWEQPRVLLVTQAPI
jgi:hypothetical protein